MCLNCSTQNHGQYSEVALKIGYTNPWSQTQRSEFNRIGLYVGNVANIFNSKFNYPFFSNPVFIGGDLPPIAKLDWVVQNIYFDKSAILTPSDLTPIVSGLNDLLAVKYFDDVDRIFDWVETPKVHTGILICFLRVTGQFRKNIQTWHNFKKKVERELTNREEDLSRKLRGLPDI